MTHLATITAKRQLTIPVALYKQAGFAKGDKVLVQEEAGELRIKSALGLVEKLAGSVSVSSAKKKVDLDQAISQAKRNYFHTQLEKEEKEK